MVMWSVIAWWYSSGWRQCLDRVMQRVESTTDFFSIDLLVRTLFAPFRQISAGGVRGSFDVQIRAFFDRLISRVVGMVVRLIMIGVGSVVIVGNLLIGVVLLLAWPLVPLMPIFGTMLFLLGWVPWSQ